MSERRFSEETKVRVPPALNEALDRAVKANFTTKSDYLRHALLVQLRADGVFLKETERTIYG
jgi:predicted DNA-binding protein